MVKQNVRIFVIILGIALLIGAIALYGAHFIEAKVTIDMGPYGKFTTESALKGFDVMFDNEDTPNGNGICVIVSLVITIIALVIGLVQLVRAIMQRTGHMEIKPLDSKRFKTVLIAGIALSLVVTVFNTLALVTTGWATYKPESIKLEGAPGVGSVLSGLFLLAGVVALIIAAKINYAEEQVENADTFETVEEVK